MVSVEILVSFMPNKNEVWKKNLIRRWFVVGSKIHFNKMSFAFLYLKDNKKCPKSYRELVSVLTKVSVHH